jgi:hypothetical protein
MSVSQWFGIAATFLFLALLLAAGIVVLMRRRWADSPPQAGWLTDDMVDHIIRRGTLSANYVPEDALDMEEIEKEEERFWSETWDESEPYWE